MICVLSSDCAWRKVVCTMWGAVSNPPSHYHYVQGPGPMPSSGPGGPILAGPNSKHLRPQSSYSLPHGSNGPGRWSWSGSNVSSFDRRQLKVPPQPARPAPVRPSHTRYTGSNVSLIFYFETNFLYLQIDTVMATLHFLALHSVVSCPDAMPKVIRLAVRIGVIYFLVYRKYCNRSACLVSVSVIRYERRTLFFLRGVYSYKSMYAINNDSIKIQRIIIKIIEIFKF